MNDQGCGGGKDVMMSAANVENLLLFVFCLWTIECSLASIMKFGAGKYLGYIR